MHYSLIWVITDVTTLKESYLAVRSLSYALVPLQSPLPQQQKTDIINLFSGLGHFVFLIFEDEGKVEVL